MPSTLSPNMSLILPTVGQEPGPNWALDLNNSLSVVDQHNHSAGSGVQITPAGMNINSDLSILSNNLTNVKSTRYTAQIAPLGAGTDIGCVYVSGADLYYNDINGNQVRLTIAGAVNGTPGSIGGLVAPATATYVPANQAFVWQSSVDTPAYSDSGPVIIRNISALSNGITISPPAVLPSNYTITLPSAPPSSTAILEMGNTGIVTTNTTLYPYLNPVGAVIMFAGNAAPAGWLVCNGATLDSVANPQYANLFTAIGTTYGGTGAADFKVPDCRGRVSVGSGTGTGLTARTLGATGGQQDLENHTHDKGTLHARTAMQTAFGTYEEYAEVISVPSYTAEITAQSASVSHGTSPTTLTDAVNVGGSTGNVNESRTDKNMQPYLVLNYIIKY